MTKCDDFPDCEYPRCKCIAWDNANKPKLAEVVKLNDGKPSLNDIPGRLRLLADQLEAGEHGEYNNCLVLIPQRSDDWPAMWGFGDVNGNNSPIITLTLALHKWVAKIMVRS